MRSFLSLGLLLAGLVSVRIVGESAQLASHAVFVGATLKASGGAGNVFLGVVIVLLVLMALAIGIVYVLRRRTTGNPFAGRDANTNAPAQGYQQLYPRNQTPPPSAPPLPTGAQQMQLYPYAQPSQPPSAPGAAMPGTSVNPYGASPQGAQPAQPIGQPMQPGTPNAAPFAPTPPYAPYPAPVPPNKPPQPGQGMSPQGLPQIRSAQPMAVTPAPSAPPAPPAYAAPPAQPQYPAQAPYPPYPAYPAYPPAAYSPPPLAPISTPQMGQGSIMPQGSGQPGQPLAPNASAQPPARAFSPQPQGAPQPPTPYVPQASQSPVQPLAPAPLAPPAPQVDATPPGASPAEAAPANAATQVDVQPSVATAPTLPAASVEPPQPQPLTPPTQTDQSSADAQTAAPSSNQSGAVSGNILPNPGTADDETAPAGRIRFERVAPRQLDPEEELGEEPTVISDGLGGTQTVLKSQIRICPHGHRVINPRLTVCPTCGSPL